MRGRKLAGAIAAGTILIGVMTLSLPVQTQTIAAPGLSGKVTSKAEGAMEGVLVTAQREGSTFTTTVASNAQGLYSFPKDRMEPGKYAITVRAIGFELPAPTSVDIPAHAAQLDLTLEKVTDTNKLASQLTTVEWLQSMPGPPEHKDLFWRRTVNCGFCHTMEKVARTKYTTEQWVPVIRRMESYDVDHTSGVERGRVQRYPNGPGHHFEPIDTMAEYLATINLSGGKTTWAYPLKTLPRPKGRATRVIVTVYPIPRQPSVIHDLAVDSKGNVWYGNSGWDYIGKLDPKTGIFSEWALPPRKADVLGVQDVQFDPDDNLWMAISGKMAKFDTTTEKWTVYDQAPGVTCSHGYMALPRPGLDTMWTRGAEGRADGKSATALCRFNYKTGKGEVFPLYDNAPPGPHLPYQTERDSKDNGYSLDFGALWETPNQSHYVVRVDGKTKATTWFPTPTPKSYPRRGAMDDQDRFWFGEFFADNIGMFDTKTERFQEFPTGIKYLSPYFVQPDKNGEVWVSNFTSDRLIRFNPKTAELTHYLMPEYYDSRKVVVDPSTNNVTIWLGSKNTAHLIRIEPLD